MWVQSSPSPGLTAIFSWKSRLCFQMELTSLSGVPKSVVWGPKEKGVTAAVYPPRQAYAQRSECGGFSTYSYIVCYAWSKTGTVVGSSGWSHTITGAPESSRPPPAASRGRRQRLLEENLGTLNTLAGLKWRGPWEEGYVWARGAHYQQEPGTSIRSGRGRWAFANNLVDLGNNLSWVF